MTIVAAKSPAGEPRKVAEPAIQRECFHGTPAKFDRFRIHELDGVHFGSLNQASHRLSLVTSRLPLSEFEKLPLLEGGQPGYIVRAQIRIDRPLRVDDQQTPARWRLAIMKAKTAGHDGLVYRNDYEMPSAAEDSYIVFSEAQISKVSFPFNNPEDVLKDSDMRIEQAAAAFWEQISRSFPEMTSGDSQLSGEDEAALALWINGDPGDRPVQSGPAFDVSWATRDRIDGALRKAVTAAGEVLFDRTVDTPPSAVLEQLRGCVNHVLFFNPPPVTLSDAQRIVLKTYAGGDFEHLGEIRTVNEFERELDDCGDCLLKFLMVELSGKEDCDSLETATQRIESAIRDLTTVASAVEQHVLEGARPPAVKAKKPRSGSSLGM